MTEPRSLLTRERPDIWLRGLALAVGLTGCPYVPKVALPDGTIYACDAWYPGDPNWPNYNPSQEEIDRWNEREDRERLDRFRKRLADLENGSSWREEKSPEWLREQIADLEKKHPQPPRIRIDINPKQDVPDEAPPEEEKSPVKKRTLDLAPIVAVPDGAMEWLLHEVGHYVASTPEERARPNYGVSASELGHDGDREWQAWAFEEIVLAPFGPARHFAPPTQRDGAAFAKSGPMPDAYLQHAAREMRKLGVDVERWRVVYGEWVRWGLRQTAKPWESTT